MPQQSASIGSEPTTITCDMLITRITARLNGQLSDAALAVWAFDRFYAVETGSEQLEAGAEEVIADTLDALMFGDEPAARLDEEELRAVVAQLRRL